MSQSESHLIDIGISWELLQQMQSNGGDKLGMVVKVKLHKPDFAKLCCAVL